MPTPSDLQTYLETLIAARAKGLRVVEYQGQRVEYKTDGELASAIADIERRIAVAQGTRIHTVRIETSKGL